MSQVLSSDTSPLSSFCEGKSAVWNEHPDIGDLLGGRPGGTLRSCQPTAAGAPGSPAAVGWHERRVPPGLPPSRSPMSGCSFHTALLPSQKLESGLVSDESTWDIAFLPHGAR